MKSQWRYLTVYLLLGLAALFIADLCHPCRAGRPASHRESQPSSVAGR